MGPRAGGMAIKSVCGVILISDDAERLARFYERALGLTFEREDHAGLLAHFGTNIGELHFAIHPPGNFKLPRAAGGSVAVAFNVDALAEHQPRLKEAGAVLVAAAHDEGFGVVETYRDPDGNTFEIVELNFDFAAHK
jgi:predicted enzyme related to lactoylglutathione lyase